MVTLISYEQGHWAWDSGYLAAGVASQHLIVDHGRAAFIDTAATAQLPVALAALQQLGLGPDAVDWVILTHIHLDHAGAAGAMLQAFPNARLAVHPRGARHMIDPSRLWAGVQGVYGPERAAELYGALIPVPADRLESCADGHPLQLGERTLICYDAPGHAQHHLVVHDPLAAVVFTGDAFGLSYRAADVQGRPFILPTTTPSQFDPEAMRATIARIAALQPRAVGLAHFGQLQDVPALQADLLTRLAAMLDRARAIGPDLSALHQALQSDLLDWSRAFGCTLPDDDLLALWALDLELNAQGLVHWLQSSAAAPAA